MSESLITLVQGMRGRGKTNYLKGRLTSVNPLFIVDLRDEYPHIMAFRSSKEFSQFVINPHSHTNGDMRQYRFSLKTQGDYYTIFQMLACVKNSTIVFDEADALFSYKKFENPLVNVFLSSRNYNNNLIYVTKRPFLLPIMVRSQVDEFIIFQTNEKRDIDYLSERLAEFPKNPRQLQKGEFIVWKTDSSPQLNRCELFLKKG